MKIVALIPARSRSKSIASKNIKFLCGKPLIYYTISEAKKSRYADRIIVSTDSNKIAKIVQKYGAEVPFLRPKKFARDDTLDFPVIRHALFWLDESGYKADYIIYLRPTNIFRTSSDIDAAVEKILKTKYDSIRAISKAAYSPYWMKRIEGDKLAPFIKTKYELARRQDLPVTYQGNGTIEVIKRETILQKASMYGSNIGFIKMDDIAAVDIDTELDFKIAEFLYPWWKDKKGMRNEQ